MHGLIAVETIEKEAMGTRNALDCWHCYIRCFNLCGSDSPRLAALLGAGLPAAANTPQLAAGKFIPPPVTVELGDLTPTMLTDCADLSTLNCDDVITSCVQVYTQHINVGNVQGQRN